MPSAQPPIPTPTTSLSQLLAWLAKRAAPLTAAMVGIAAILWSDFRHEFSLPIGFASSSVLSALPSIAAIVLSAVACLSVALAMPGQVLTVRIRPDGPTLAALVRTPIDPATGERTNVRPSRIIERYWIGMAVVSGLGWAGVIAWASVVPDGPIGSGFLVMLAVTLLQTASGSWVLRRALDEPQPCSGRFYGMLLLAHVLQAYVGFFVVYVLLQSVTAVSVIDLTYGIAKLIAAMVGVAGVQLIVAQRMLRGWYPDLFKHLVYLAIGIMAAVSLVPPVGARAASFALLSSATPHTMCSVLLFGDAPRTAALRPIVDDQTPTQSKPLKVVFPFDGLMYVKASVDAPTFVIDGKTVAGTAACPDAHATAKKGSSTEVAPYAP